VDPGHSALSADGLAFQATRLSAGCALLVCLAACSSSSHPAAKATLPPAGHSPASAQLTLAQARGIFAVVAGNWRARPAYPKDGTLAIAGAHTREAAKGALARLHPAGGTAIGKWLLLARELFQSREDELPVTNRRSSNSWNSAKPPAGPRGRGDARGRRQRSMRPIMAIHLHDAHETAGPQRGDRHRQAGARPGVPRAGGGGRAAGQHLPGGEVRDRAHRCRLQDARRKDGALRAGPDLCRPGRPGAERAGAIAQAADERIGGPRRRCIPGSGTNHGKAGGTCPQTGKRAFSARSGG